MFFLFFQPSLYEIPSISPSAFSQHFGSLLEEADEMDNIHDVTLQAGDRTFPAHKYILSMRSEFFRKEFMSENCGNDEELEKEVRKSEDAVGCDLLIFEKIPPDMLEYALHFIYTDSCELLVHGSRPRVSGTLTGQNQVRGKNTKVFVLAVKDCHILLRCGYFMTRVFHIVCCLGQVLEEERLISSLQDLGLRGRSALEVYRSLPAATKGGGDKAKSKGSKPGKKAKGKADKAGANEGGGNPVKTLQGVGKKLGLGSLSAR